MRKDAPEVGGNLQDHIQMRTIVELADRGLSLNDHMANPISLAKMGLERLINGSGPLSVGAGQVGGAMSTKCAEGGRPDIQLFVMPLSVDKPGKPLHAYSGFTTSFWQCHPESRGSIHINSIDPGRDPTIRMNYFAAQRDRDVTVEGLKILREIYRQRVLSFPDLTGARLLREIREVGYAGGYTAVTDFLREVRPPRQTAFERRFETPPGRQAQMDLAEFAVAFTDEPGFVRKVWLFSMVLGYSRWLWERFVASQNLQSVRPADGWACRSFVPPQSLGQATFRSKATGLFQRSVECRRRRLKKGRLDRPFS